MNDQLVIILTAVLTASACALVGVFLVLRKMSLLGDAISHAVLPGLVLAFLLTGSLSPMPMLLGAGAVGVLTAALIEFLARTGRVSEDAGVGVVFPAMFALGVLLLTLFAGSVHLDTEHVLYGELAFVPFHPLVIGGADVGPRALWTMAAVTAVNLAFVAAFWKELKVGTFDPAFAAAVGLAPGAVQYLLMGAVSLTTVAAFESVGAILVVALLVVPAATAYLLTERLPTMTLLAVACGAVSAIGGYALAHRYDLSIAGAMALMCGVLFAAAWLFAPRHGVVGRWLARRRTALRLAGELLLARLPADGSPGPTAAGVAERFRWTPRRAAAVIADLTARGLAACGPDGRIMRRADCIPPGR
jgi:manganese/zinc/iron transport system permease protein